MVKKLSAIRKYWDNITTPATSRWGIVFALLAVCAILITIGVGGVMNWWVRIGCAFGILAVVLSIFWLIKGSKDPTATKSDIKGLSNEIRELRKVIRQGIIAGGKRGRWH